MKQDCTFCNVLITDQKAQLATPSHKLKKDQKIDKKDSGNSSTLMDQDHVSVIGAVNNKFPDEKVVKDQQKSKKSIHPSLLLTRT